MQPTQICKSKPHVVSVQKHLCFVNRLTFMSSSRGAGSTPSYRPSDNCSLILTTALHLTIKLTFTNRGANSTATKEISKRRYHLCVQAWKKLKELASTCAEFVSTWLRCRRKPAREMIRGLSKY